MYIVKSANLFFYLWEDGRDVHTVVSFVEVFFWNINLFVIVLAVLRKNYRKLFECLPEDYASTLNKMGKIGKVPADSLKCLARLPSIKAINECIMSQLLYVIMKHDADALQLCDTMKELVGDSTPALQFIETLRQGSVLYDGCYYILYFNLWVCIYMDMLLTCSLIALSHIFDVDITHKPQPLLFVHFCWFIHVQQRAFDNIIRLHTHHIRMNIQVNMITLLLSTLQ